MTLLFVFIALAFTVFTLYKTIHPFLGSRQGQLRVELLDDELRSIELLVARKTALVQSLRELEYDWQTSKISEEDYERFKKSYERQAIGIMRRLDAIHGGRAWEQNIDDELARRLGESDQDNVQKVDDNAAEHVHATESTTTSSQPNSPAAENVCDKCEKPLLADDIFCARCGHRVAQKARDEDDESFSQNSKTTNKSLRPEVTQ